MTRYYFHLRSGDDLMVDDEGAEFADYAAALREATLAARELLVDAMPKPLHASKPSLTVLHR